MAQNEIATRGDENFAVHAAWLAERTPNMLVGRVSNVLFIDSRLPSDTFNIVCRSHSSASSPDTTAQADTTTKYICEHFSGVERPFSWWVSNADSQCSLHQELSDSGLVATESELAMILNLQHFVPPSNYPDFRIERVASREHLKAFASIIAANWDPPDRNVLCYYRNVAEAALYAECPIRLFIGYESAKPVATAEVTFGCGAAGIYSVATLEDYRRRGFATAIVSHALSAAKHEGLGLAFLQSSERNAGIYERLGFETYGLITEYKPRTLRC